MCIVCAGSAGVQRLPCTKNSLNVVSVYCLVSAAFGAQRPKCTNLVHPRPLCSNTTSAACTLRCVLVRCQTASGCACCLAVGGGCACNFHNFSAARPQAGNLLTQLLPISPHSPSIGATCAYCIVVLPLPLSLLNCAKNPREPKGKNKNGRSDNRPSAKLIELFCAVFLASP